MKPKKQLNTLSNTISEGMEFNESVAKFPKAPIQYSPDHPILENDKAMIWELSNNDYEVWMKLTYSTGKKKDQIIEPSDEDFGVKAWTAYSLEGAKHIYEQITQGKRKITPMLEDKEIRETKDKNQTTNLPIKKEKAMSGPRIPVEQRKQEAFKIINEFPGISVKELAEKCGIIKQYAYKFLIAYKKENKETK